MKKLLQFTLLMLFITGSMNYIQAAEEETALMHQGKPVSMTESQVDQANTRAQAWAKKTAQLPNTGGKLATDKNLIEQHNNLLNKTTLNGQDKITLQATKVALNARGINLSPTPTVEAPIEGAKSGSFNLIEQPAASPRSVTNLSETSVQPNMNNGIASPDELFGNKTERANPLFDDEIETAPAIKETVQTGKINLTPEQVNAFKQATARINPKDLAIQLRTESESFAKDPNDPQVQKDLINKIRTSFYQGRIDEATVTELDGIIGDALEKSRDEGQIINPITKQTYREWFSKALQNIKDTLTYTWNRTKFGAQVSRDYVGNRASSGYDSVKSAFNKPVDMTPRDAMTADDLTPKEQSNINNNKNNNEPADEEIDTDVIRQQQAVNREIASQQKEIANQRVVPYKKSQTQQEMDATLETMSPSDKKNVYQELLEKQSDATNTPGAPKLSSNENYVLKILAKSNL